MSRASAFRVYRRPENGLESWSKKWPDRPRWLVDVLAPGIDFYNIAGFPTWREAFDYACVAAVRDVHVLLTEEDVS